MEDLFASDCPTLEKTNDILGTKIHYECVDGENCQIAKYVPLVNWNTDNALIIFFDTFLKNKQSENTTARILELGSGLGIPSIYLAKHFNFKSISINDGDLTSIEFINKNITKNGPYKTNNLEVLHFWWFFNESEIENDPNMKNQKLDYDYIIGSDVIYDKTTVRSLLFTIKSFLKLDGFCVLTNFYSRFYKNETEFLKCVTEFELHCEISKTGENDQTIVCLIRHIKQ